MLNHWKTRLPFFPIWPEMADLDGILIPIRNSPFPPFLRRHLLAGGYEVAERKLVDEFVRPDDRVLEIGASAGVLSSFLWRKVGRNGRVVSVEGNPALRKWFEAQLASNGFSGEWKEAVCWPTWDESVQEQVRQTGLMPRDNPLGSSVVEGSEPCADGAWQSAAQICNDCLIDPTVVIVDIEGMETVWVEYPPKIPRCVRILIVEFHPTLVDPRLLGRSIQALVEEGFAVCGMSGTVLAFSR